MRTYLTFLLLLFIFFLPNFAEADTGKCICEPKYKSETEYQGSGDCRDRYIRVCETECSSGENCTSWKKYINRWQVCETDEDGDEHCHCESNKLCSIDYEREYNCTAECNGRLQERIHETGCNTGRTSWVDTREGFAWQKCDPDVPGFYCYGECIEPPGNLEHYESPTSAVEASNPVRLPVRLDWDDVPGWWGGWSGGGGSSAIQAYADCQKGYIDDCWEEAWGLNPDSKCQGEVTPDYLVCLRRETKENCSDLLEEEECEEECPPEEECYKPEEFIKSYRLVITGDMRGCGDSDINKYEAVLHVSELIPPCSCFFKSNREYDWTVRACCTEDGKNCGPPSTAHFKTSLAPELTLPPDPDWAGDGEAKNLSFEATRELQWCEVEDPTYYYEPVAEYHPLSFKVQIKYLEGESYICHPLLGGMKDGECTPAFLGPNGKLPPNKLVTKGLITENTTYAWQVAACRDNNAMDCTEYSQEWKLSSSDWEVVVVRNNPPNNSETPIGLPVNLSWSSLFANSFNYKIYEGKKDSCSSVATITDGETTDQQMRLDHNENAEAVNPILKLDTVYTWCIQPCRDFKSEDCEDTWGGPWYFRTTGHPPEAFSSPENENVSIPVNFDWETVSGAKSYVLKIWGDDLNEEIIINEGSEFSMAFPEYNMLPATDYSWQVKSCAESGGNLCGIYSGVQTFSTFDWEEPSNPEPDTLYAHERPYTVSWGEVTGANFYKYEVRFAAPDEDDPREECQEMELGKVVASGIVPQNSANLPLECWGEYEWRITPCLDRECNILGPESSFWPLKIIAEFLPSDTESGLIPCNQDFVNPDTPWIETEPCEIKHLFIIIYIIVDFLFIRVLPMILVLLVLASGVIFYFSVKMEAPHPAAKVKSLWKAAGIGIAILLFAWTITSLLLNLFGYRMGPWNIFNI